VKLRSEGIGDIAELNDVITAMKKGGATTLIVQPSPLTYRQRDRFIDPATRLVVNLKTALGLTIPQSLLLQATEIIQ